MDNPLSLVEMITTVGFPIACVVGMGYYFVVQTKYEREENSKREERLFTMIENNAKVISENTKAIQDLKIVIERGN